MAGLIASWVTSLGYPEPIRIPMLAGSDCRFWRARGVPAFVYGTSPRNVSAPTSSSSVSEVLRRRAHPRAGGARLFAAPMIPDAARRPPSGPTAHQEVQGRNPFEAAAPKAEIAGPGVTGGIAPQFFEPRI